jgi:glutamate/aspartate transport system permease protein
MTNFDFFAPFHAWSFLLKGFLFTVEITVVAAIGGMVLGTALALCRLSKSRPLSWFALSYVTLMRSIPLILVIFWIFFFVPVGLGLLYGRPVPVGANATIYITFVLFEAAYFAEIVRSGLQSIPRGQYEAAKALGMRPSMVFRLVILPQLVRNTMPVLLTQTIILFQDTSLVYVISAIDFVGAATKIGQRDGKLIEMYCTVGVVYFVICYGASNLVKVLSGNRAITAKRALAAVESKPGL